MVNILNVLDKAGVATHFLVVGTHALYAFETAAGVRIAEQAMATRDVDMLFDARKRLERWIRFPIALTLCLPLSSICRRSA